MKSEDSEALQDPNDEVQDREDLKKCMAVIKTGKHGRGYQCSLCRKGIKTMSNMMSHVRNKHFKSAPTTGTSLEPASASVEQCVKSEDSEANHEIKDWEDLKRFAIVIEKGKHGSGEHRSYQCSLCGKIAKGRGKLASIMSHIECKHFKNAFTHKCDICQESYKTKGILKSHKKSMHKGQPCAE